LHYNSLQFPPDNGASQPASSRHRENFLAHKNQGAYIRRYPRFFAVQGSDCSKQRGWLFFFIERGRARTVMTTLHPQSVATPPILLTISGFDPSCGAGIAADLKTFAAYGCYGVAAITSMTIQNTQGVEAVHNTPSAELREQLEVLAKDCEIAAVKIGMLGNRGNAVVVAEFLDQHKFTHVVHDPVMHSSSNSELLDAGGINYLAAELLKRSSVILPNVVEAETLTGMSIKDTSDMEAAARKLVDMGAHAVIVKGGHMEKAAVDVLFDGVDMQQLSGDKLRLEQAHGAGCTFASAITAQLAAGRSLLEATTLAKAYVVKAIEKAYPVGKGLVPLDHFYRMKIEPMARGTHEVPQHGLHPAAEPAAH
jgi:hydroxymethylpyrimidine kinase/phosphomethylpyrimidine kinase